MKKKILILTVSLLFITINLYAAGDLIVNGKLGVGTTVSNSKISINSTTENFGLNVLLTRDTTGPVWGSSYFIFLDGTSGTYTDEAGGLNNTTVYRRQTDSGSGSLLYAGANNAYIGTTGGSGYTVDNMSSLLVQNGMHAGFNSTVTLTNGYGILSRGLQKYGVGGTLTVSNFRHIYLQDKGIQAGNSTLNVTNQSGIWIDKQEMGNTINYGIVLNGDGAGADIVFGDSQQASIYSTGGLLYATDMNGNITQFSPHDPETGEWIYYSKNIKTGKTVRVNMEKLVEAVEKLTGETFMIESVER